MEDKDLKVIHEKILGELQLVKLGVEHSGREITQISTKVGIQNGRVTNLEHIMQTLEIEKAVLREQLKGIYNIISKQDQQYEKFVQQREKINEDDEKKYFPKSDGDLIKKIVLGISGSILLAFGGALIKLIIK